MNQRNPLEQATVADATAKRDRCYQRWLRGDAYTSELQGWKNMVHHLETVAGSPRGVQLTVIGGPDREGLTLAVVEWDGAPFPGAATTGRMFRLDVASYVAFLQAKGHTVTVKPWGT